MNNRISFCISALAVLSTACIAADSSNAGQAIPAASASRSTSWPRRIAGVSCTLRADREEFSFYDRPAFKAYVSSHGESQLWLATIAEQRCFIVVDGVRLQWTRPLWTDAMMQTAQSSWLAENGAYLSVTLDERFLRGLDGSKPARLKPGEHTVSFGWAGYESDPADGSARTDKPIVLESNPVRITVTEPSPGSQPPADDRRSLVKQLFESYVHPAPLNEAEKKAGLKIELRSYDFWAPRFEWGDINVLLELASGDKPAGRIPSLMISSYAQRQCSDGMIALWLIEGLRRKQAAVVIAARRNTEAPAGLWYRLPLNPICVEEGVGVRYCEDSPRIHAEALARYRLWWRKVASMQPEDAAMYDPLAGTKLQWYGGMPVGKPLDE